MKEVKKIKKIPTANLLAFIYSIVGFVFGVGFYSFFVISAIVHDHGRGALSDFVLVNIMFTILLGLVVAFFTGLLGWLLGFIFSLLYNLFADKVHGAQLHLEDKN